MILVALGANLPGPGGRSPLRTCCNAAAALGRISGLRLRGLSRWYVSAPVPPSGQPPYVNGVALLEGGAEPSVLLAALHAIEDAQGRRRSVANAARTLDLDLIALDELVRDAPDPILPHPRAHERAFVLLPLAELVPDWVHPRLGRPLAELLRALPEQEIRPLRGNELA